MKKCVFCGKENQDVAATCSACGNHDFRLMTTSLTVSGGLAGSGQKSSHVSDLLRKYSNLISRSGGSAGTGEAIDGSKDKPPMDQPADVVASSAEPGLEPDSSVAAEWYYAVGNERHGALSELDLIAKIKAGELDKKTQIWKEGLPKWILLKNSHFIEFLPKDVPPPLDEGKKALPFPIPSPVPPIKSVPAPMETPAVPKPQSRGNWASFLDEIQKLICKISDLPPLEHFRWRDIFSQSLKFRGRDEIDRYFNCGCSQTTPPIAEIQVRWPRPWAFSQVLLLGLLALAGFYVCVEWFENLKAIPGLIIVGGFAVPLACVVFFFEINILRNISVFQIAKLMVIGGVVSLTFSLILYGITKLDETPLGNTAAGPIEETGKLLAAIFLMGRIRSFKWILNGLLIGAAIGAGFAGFESAGYIYNAGHNPYEVLFLRAFMSPFCHVVWTASAVGALWKTKGDDPFSFKMLFRKDFLRIFAFVVALHMLWDSGLLWLVPSGTAARGMFCLWIFVTVGSWYLVLTLAQAGLKQIQAAQQCASAPKPNTQSQNAACRAKVRACRAA